MSWFGREVRAVVCDENDCIYLIPWTVLPFYFGWLLNTQYPENLYSREREHKIVKKNTNNN